MRTNADFGKFLLEVKPQTRPAVLTFYNYLRNFTDLNTAFTPETVSRFYLKALSFDFWQKNILELTQETKNVLDRFLGQEMQAKAWQDLRHADELQIVKIKNKKDQLEIIKQYIGNFKGQNRFQIFSDKNNISHAVILYPQGDVQVVTFDDHACIQNGQIVPMSLDRKLKYTQKLELVPNVYHFVQVSPFITAKFSILGDRISGDLIRGYTLQNYRKIEIHELHQEPPLLYAIKKIERFFIDRSSEPLYVELLGVLEQTVDFLRKDLEGSVELAQKAYIRGKNVLENIFIDDKMLEVLLKEIHSLIVSKGQSLWIPKTKEQAQYELTNSSPRLEFALEDQQID
jgi:hypothetical protein